MNRQTYIIRCMLSAVDVGLGILLMIWPGVWHELVHGSVERTTFYLAQAGGILMVTRGLTSMKLEHVASLYGLGVPAVVYLGWSTAHTGPWAGPVYLGFALVWSASAWFLQRTPES